LFICRLCTNFGVGLAGKLLQEEFLRDVVHNIAGDGQKAVGEGQRSSLAVGWGVVEVGDGAGGHIADEAGVGGLRTAIIAAADDDGFERVTEPGANGPVAFEK
jgi:hypothetical protein